MAFRTVLLFCVMAGVAFCADQDFVNSQMFSPDGIRHLRKQMRTPPKAGIYQEKVPDVKIASAGPQICSVPLLEAHAHNPDPHSIVPIPKVEFDHMAGPNPAPACKGWNKEKDSIRAH